MKKKNYFSPFCEILSVSHGDVISTSFNYGGAVEEKESRSIVRFTDL